MLKERTALLTAAILAFAVTSSAPLSAADAPRELKWAELKPKTLPPAKRSKRFFAGSAKRDDAAPPPRPTPEGKFMSMKRRQPGGDRPPAVVPELDGKLVSIGGYLVPLDFESTAIKEFLLVPFVGACIHVPPPPSNQIVFVKFDEGLEITGPFDPVKVVGTMKTETAFTGLADAGYSINADTVTVIAK